MIDIDKLLKNIIPIPQTDEIDKLMKNIIPLSHWSSGEASLCALKQIVQELTSTAPEDHDVFIEAYDLIIFNVRYFEPHTFVLCGLDNQRNEAFEVIHYSQLKVRITHSPKKEEKRRIIGFRTE